MSPRLIRAYHKQIAKLEAADDLRATVVAIYPHQEQNARDEVRQRLLAVINNERGGAKTVGLDGLKAFAESLGGGNGEVK